MATRYASCRALAPLRYCSPTATLRHQAPASAAPPTTAATESWRAVMASELEPETFYCPIAYTRAPFVNVYALYRRGAPAIPSAKSEATEPVGDRHFLLAGPQTAEPHLTTSDAPAWTTTAPL